MLTILQDAAVGGMTATKFSTLQTLASMLNQPDGITMSSYVQQIADDVINGNSANAMWNGGSIDADAARQSQRATSTQTQVNELIGKWFLGTDLPSLDVSAIGEQNLNPIYEASTLPLFGSSGTPSYLDVNQGYLGDCYFVAALGETALKDPSLIENMITSNGNGTYSVCFYINGQADYVTVNSQLPYMGGGYSWANGSTQEFANGSVDDWVALVEKAFAELNGQSAAASYGGHPTGNAYEDLNGGTAITLSEITDQTFNTYNLTPARIEVNAQFADVDALRRFRRRRRGHPVDAQCRQRQSGRRPHVHRHRGQRLRRHDLDPESLEHRLFRLAADELHRHDRAARRRQRVDLRHHRNEGRLTGRSTPSYPCSGRGRRSRSARMWARAPCRRSGRAGSASGGRGA